MRYGFTSAIFDGAARGGGRGLVSRTRKRINRVCFAAEELDKNKSRKTSARRVVRKTGRGVRSEERTKFLVLDDIRRHKFRAYINRHEGGWKAIMEIHIYVYVNTRAIIFCANMYTCPCTYALYSQDIYMNTQKCT